MKEDEEEGGGGRRRKEEEDRGGGRIEEEAGGRRRKEEEESACSQVEQRFPCKAHACQMVSDSVMGAYRLSSAQLAPTCFIRTCVPIKT